MYDLPGTGTFIVCCLICAVLGWGVIEGLIYLCKWIF